MAHNKPQPISNSSNEEPPTITGDISSLDAAINWIKSTIVPGKADSNQPKPSFASQAMAVDDFIAKYKLTSTLAHITHFVKTDRATVKLALMVAILENYQEVGVIASAEQFIKLCPYLDDFFTMLLNFKERPMEIAQAAEGAVQVMQQAAFKDAVDDDVWGRLLFDPTLTIEQQEPATATALQFLDKNIRIVRPILGFASVFACSMGFAKLMKLDWLASISKEVVQLGSLFRAKRVIVEEVNTGVDSILSLIYSSMGGEYLTEKQQRLKRIAQRVERVRSALQMYLDKTKTDVFGLLKCESIPTLSEAIDTLQSEIAGLSAEEVNIYNFRDGLMECRTMLKSLRDRRVALIKGGSKQIPVRVWFAGSAGVGKTHLAARIAHRVCGQRSVYTRNSHDKHWNTYSGQACVIFDDILQNQESDDANEWMTFSTEASKDVTMAELHDKGMPFTSRFMFATSNLGFMVDHKAIKDMEAFNRRRDFLVHAFNPHIKPYKDTHNGQEPPEEWYVQHPTELRLYNPLRNVPLTAAPTPGFIGCVTEDELCIMIAEMEKANAEKFRKVLIARGLDQAGLGITIPPEPFTYDRRKFDTVGMFDPITRRPKFDLNAPQAVVVNAPREEDELSEVSTVDSGIPLRPEAVNVSPVRVKVFQKFTPLILMGPPGVGKTYIVDKFLEVMASRHPNSHVHKLTPASFQNPTWLADLNASGSMVFFDDFTTDDQTIDAMRKICCEMDAGRLRVVGLIATGNEDTKQYDGDAKKMIERRSLVFTLAPNNSVRLARMYRKCELQQVLDDPKYARETHVSVKCNKSENNCTYGQLLTTLELLSNVGGNARQLVATDTFTLPYPENCDVICSVDFSSFGGGPASFEEVWDAIRKVVAYRRQQDGQFVKMSGTELFKGLTSLRSAFTTKAFGDPHMFVRQFNEEKNKAPHDLHVVACIKCPPDSDVEDMAFGFIPVDGILVAYLVEPDSAKIEVVGDDIFVNGILINTNQHNSVYHRAVKRAFEKEYKFVEPPPMPQEKDVLVRLLRTTPWGEFISAAVSLTSIAVKGMAWAALIMSIDERSGPTDDVEEERRKNPPKTQNKKDPSDPDSVVDNPKNNVDAERRKNPPKTQNKKDPSDPDSVVDQPKNNVDAERRKNPPKTQNKKDPSDPDSVLEQPKNNVDAEAYDTFDKRSKQNAIVAEYLNVDGTLVTCNGQYGVLNSQLVYYADECAKGTWRFMAVPLTDDWELVAESARPGRVLFGKHYIDIAYKKQQPDSAVLRSLLGKIWIRGVESPEDLGSVLACMFAYGWPLDIERAVLCPQIVLDCGADLAVEIRSKEFISQAQRHYKQFARAVVRVANEGMQDPELSAIGLRAAHQAVSIMNGEDHYVYGLRVGGKFVLSVGHAFDIEDPYFRLDGKEYHLELLVRNKRCDLALAKVTDPTYPAARNIAHLFVTREEIRKFATTQLNNLPGMVIRPPGFDSQFIFATNCNITAMLHGADDAGYNGRQLNYNAQWKGLSLTGVSRAGDCGSLVLLSNRQLKGRIIGMHRAGNASISVGSIVTQDWLQEMMNDPSVLQQDANPSTFSPAKAEGLDFTPMGLTPIQYDNITLHSVRVCSSTQLNWVGDLERSVYVPDTTRIKRTGLCLPEGYDVHEPSIMSTKDPRCDGWDPYWEGLKRYGEKGTEHSPDRARVQEAFAEIGNELVSRINAQKQKVRVLTKTEALNTPPFIEHPNAHSIDRSGSAGFPHNLRGSGSTKSDYLFFNEKHQKWFFKSDAASQAISARVNTIVQNALKAKQHSHPFVAYLKDEPLTIKKIYETKKTRLFFSGSFEYLLAYRQYFLSAMLRVMELYSVIPAKVGISPDMTDWHTLATSLRAVSNRGFASDVSSFDSSVPSVFLEEVAQVFNAIYTHCSLPGEKVEEGNLVRTVLHRSIEGAMVIARKSVFKLDQAQVSGNPATALENSFIMWALYYLVWKDLALQHAPNLATYQEFRKNVELAVYGDDNICTVSPHAPWFNFNSFKEKAAHYGFKITDAQKTGGEVPDFQALEDMDFLKRGFRYIQNWWTGPLDLRSIGKSLAWIRDKQYTITKDCVPRCGGAWPQSNNADLISASVQSTWPELALHGEDTYNEWVKFLVPQFGELGITAYPPTWEAAMGLYHYKVYSARRLSTT